jgi:hypothetical protein
LLARFSPEAIWGAKLGRDPNRKVYGFLSTSRTGLAALFLNSKNLQKFVPVTLSGTIPLVFDKGDVREGLSGPTRGWYGCGHGVMISLLQTIFL